MKDILEITSEAIDKHPFSIVIINTDGCVEYVNERFCRFYNYSREAVINKHISITKSRNNNSKLMKKFLKAITFCQLWSGEVINITADGQEYLCKVNMWPIAGSKTGTPKIVIMEEPISPSVDKNLLFIKEFINVLPGLVFFKDVSGKLIGSNKAYKKAFGITEKEFFNGEIKTLANFYDAGEAGLLKNEEISYRQVKRKFVDGKIHELAYWKCKFDLEDEVSNITIGVMVDISDIKENEKQLERALNNEKEVTEAKNIFIANISHEIRTPMNAIIGMAYLALKTELTEKQKDYILKIYNSGTALLGIINDILDLSKMEHGKFDMENIDFSIEEVLTNIINKMELTALNKGIKIIYNLDPSIPLSLVGDPLRLEQVIINLVSNAVKFTVKGEVTIEIKTIDRTGDKLQLQFEVKDTGIGITKKQLEGLFKPFSQADTSTTRKYGGSGLGLSICKKLVGLMEGNIWAKSQPKVGSSFYFTARFKVSKKVDQYSIYVPKELKVLVADDNKFARKSLSDYLKGMCFKVQTAVSGIEAISKVKECDTSEPYNLVFMDWQMPKMDGIQAAKAIKEDKTLVNTPAVIIVTAFEREDIMYKADTVKVDGYLTKPFNKANMQDIILNVLALDKEKLNEQPETSKQNYEVSGIRVLLAEDNEINQQIVVELMQVHGVKVTLAQNGIEAVEKFVKDKYDIIFMDIQMPELDGIEATKIIRKKDKEIPIIAMTARTMFEEQQLYFKIGMNDHIAKPIDPHMLFTTIAKWTPKNKKTVICEKKHINSFKIHKIDGIDFKSALKRAGNNYELYVELLMEFSKREDSILSNIKSAIDQCDYLEIEKILHDLKGVSANIGAVELYDYIKEFEIQVKERVNIMQIHNLFLKLQMKYKGLSNNIRKVLKDYNENIYDFKIDEFKAMLKELKKLLVESDVTAIDIFKKIKRAGKNNELINKLEARVYEYDFDAAVDIVNKLEKKI